MGLKGRNTIVILNQLVSEYFLFLHTRNKLIKQVILEKYWISILITWGNVMLYI